MLPTEKYGIYHVRNEGFLSWCAFARMIMEKAGLPCRVVPVFSYEYPTPAKRPLNSRLDGSRLKINKAYLTMVALDENDVPTPVPPLELTSAEERAEWELAEIRRKK